MSTEFNDMFELSMKKLKENCKSFEDTLKGMDAAELEALRYVYKEGVLVGLNLGKEWITKA